MGARKVDEMKAIIVDLRKDEVEIKKVNAITNAKQETVCNKAPARDDNHIRSERHLPNHRSALWDDLEILMHFANISVPHEAH